MATRAPTQHRSAATACEVARVKHEFLAIRSSDRGVRIVVAGALLTIGALDWFWDRNTNDYGDDVRFFLGRLTAAVDTLEAMGVMKGDQTRLSGGMPLHLLPV